MIVPLRMDSESESLRISCLIIIVSLDFLLLFTYLLSDHHRVTGLSSFYVSLVWSSSCHWTFFFSLHISCMIIIVSLNFLLLFTYLLYDHHRITGLSSSLYVSLVWSSSCHWTFFFSLRISCLIIIVSLDFLLLFTYLLSDHHRVTRLCSSLCVSLVWSSSYHWTFFFSLRISCLIIIVSLDFLLLFTYLLSDHHRVTGLSSSLYVSLVWSSSCH